MADHQAQSTNFKEAFSLFDKRGTGRVQLDSLGDLLRACGQNPTLAEIGDLEGQVGGDCEYTPVPACERSVFRRQKHEGDKSILYGTLEGRTGSSASTY